MSGEEGNLNSARPVMAVLVTYRRLGYLKRTVRSLTETLPRGSRLVIVDNASEGEEYAEYLAHLERAFPLSGEKGVRVQALRMENNEGWGRAVNAGLASFGWSFFEYVLLSNNDVEYKDLWAEKSQGLFKKYPKMGLLGLWKHPHHGVQQALEDVLIKDDMPAVAWVFRSKDLRSLLPFPEHGVTKNSGGNGEDTAVTVRVKNSGRWVCGPRDDLAEHLDGYNLPNLGKPNPEYD